jgi:vacuolar-type H+-ATPase subunit I/STV1
MSQPPPDEITLTLSYSSFEGVIMAGTTSMSGGGATVPRQSAEVQSEVTGWVGWIVFAGTMMMLIGVFHLFEGIIALFRNTVLVVPQGGLVVSVSFTQWGWMQLIAGVLIFAAGLGVFTGRTWARVLGVIFASISAILNFAFITAFPVWSLTVIALDIVVIYALTAHGAEMKAARDSG